MKRHRCRSLITSEEAACAALRLPTRVTSPRLLEQMLSGANEVNSAYPRYPRARENTLTHTRRLLHHHTLV